MAQQSARATKKVRTWALPEGHNEQPIKMQERNLES
jgi:hypothetical protein